MNVVASPKWSQAEDVFGASWSSWTSESSVSYSDSVSYMTAQTIKLLQHFQQSDGTMPKKLKEWRDVATTMKILGPFIRGKIRRVLHKTHPT